MSKEDTVENVTFGNGTGQPPSVVNRGSRKSQEPEEEGLLANNSKPQKKSMKEKATDLIDTCYNKEFREFLGKDAMDWLKFCAFYATFYFWLMCFFCVLLFGFWALRIRGQSLPVYYNQESVMHYKKVNPGLGFRPHLNPESELVYIDINNSDANVQSMNNFLEKYQKNKENTYVNGHDEQVSFNIDEILGDSPCSPANNYSMNTKSPCVAVKMNRIVGWLPEPVNLDQLPAGLNETIKELNDEKSYVYISCTGQEGTDSDQLKEIDYYSSHSSNKVGGIDFKYFPYMNQPSFVSPLVFVHFKDVSINTLINVVCKAYAGNIDNSDRLNQRGMIKFQLYVEDLTNKVTQPETTEAQETTVEAVDEKNVEEHHSSEEATGEEKTEEEHHSSEEKATKVTAEEAVEETEPVEAVEA